MKTISTTQKPNGKRRVTVELDAGETLLAVRDGAHYKLGHPVEEVMAAHILSDAQPVTWCSASQEWTT